MVDIFCQSLDSIADSCQKTYKPSSPQSERLTLRVTKFKFLGSQGERAFGKPEAIEEQESIWEVLNRLDKVLEGSESDTNGSDGEVDIRSQAGDIEDQLSSPITSMATQTAFATQVPAEIGRNCVRSAVEVPKNPSVSKGVDLLALLHMPKETAVVVERTTDAQIPNLSHLKSLNYSGDRSIVTSNSDRPKNQNGSVFQPVSESRKAVMSSKLESKANKPSPLLSRDSREDGLPPKESNLPHLSNVVPDDGSEKENSQESSKESVSRLVPYHQEAEVVTEAMPRNVSDMLIARNRKDNPFEDMKRVPRSYVRIPPNQQAILDSPDSWYKPEIDSRATFANVPPDVARELNSFIDRIERGRGKCQTVLDESEGDDGSEDGSGLSSRAGMHYFRIARIS